MEKKLDTFKIRIIHVIGNHIGGMYQMKRKKTAIQSSPERVLARVLAEDLRNVGAGGCTCPDEPATPTITGGGSDITNIGGDGD